MRRKTFWAVSQRHTAPSVLHAQHSAHSATVPVTPWATRSSKELSCHGYKVLVTRPRTLGSANRQNFSGAAVTRDPQDNFKRKTVTIGPTNALELFGVAELQNPMFWDFNAE